MIADKAIDPKPTHMYVLLQVSSAEASPTIATCSFNSYSEDSNSLTSLGTSESSTRLIEFP